MVSSRSRPLGKRLEIRIELEHTLKNHIGKLDHQWQRMFQSVNFNEGIEKIKSNPRLGAPCTANGISRRHASCVNRKETLVTIAFTQVGDRRQHGRRHAQFLFDTAQFLDRGGNVMNRNKRRARIRGVRFV